MEILAWIGVVMMVLFVWILLLVIIGLKFPVTSTIGAVFLFNKYWRVILPGMRPTIPWVERVEIYSTAVQQFELPGEPEEIDRVSENPPPGKKAPYRIAHKGKEEAIFYIEKVPGAPIDPKDPLSGFNAVRYKDLDEEVRVAMDSESLHMPITAEYSVSVEEHLYDTYDAVGEFIANVEPANGRTREEEVRKRMDDMVHRTLQDYLGLVTFSHALERKPLFDALLKLRLEVLVGEKWTRKSGIKSGDKPWGRHVVEAYIKNAYPGHTVNTARASAVAAVSDREAMIRRAEGESESIMKIADARAHETKVDSEARAHAEEQQGIGESARIGHMAKALQTEEGRFAAALDVVEKIWPTTTQTVILPGGRSGVIGDMMGMLAGVSSVFGQNTPSAEKPAEVTKPTSEKESSAKE